MTVKRDYMLHKPLGPSALTGYLHIKILPFVIKLASKSEIILDRAASRTGLRPAVILIGAAALSSFGIVRLVRLRTFRRAR